MNIDVVLKNGAFMPEKAHNADAGFDIKTPYTVVIQPHDSIVVDTGVCMLIPEGYVGMLKSKSGLNVKHGITGEGVVDAHYKGSIVAKLYNHSDEPHIFNTGDKLIQIVLLPIPDVTLNLVKSFSVETERGENGFGSTGV